MDGVNDRGSQDDVPKFAVVGQVNEGKSSVLATLVEEGDQSKIRVSEMPGETARCQSIVLEINGRKVLEFIDTPGFQRARQALAWMKEHHEKSGDTTARVDSIKAFVEEFRDTRDFEDETRLLEPVLEGVGIVYVVDDSKPVRPNHLAEMEILRWTGRPRMAILNNKGSGNDEFSVEWKKYLRESFNLTRVFNAHRARFRERIRLLQHLLEIEEGHRPVIEDTIRLLEQEWDRRRNDAADIIVELLEKCLCQQTCQNVSGDQVNRRRKRKLISEELTEKYRHDIRKVEDRQHRRLVDIYRHQEAEPEVVGHSAEAMGDLFARETWQVMGLSRTQLVMTGVAGGAAVGLVGDLAIGGLSGGIPTLIGGVVGGGLALWKGKSLAEIAVSNPLSLSGKTKLGSVRLCAGPPKNPNFPWVLLDRILFYYENLITRAHGRRDAFVIDMAELEKGETGRRGYSSRFSSSRQKKLGKWLGQLGPKKTQASADDESQAWEEICRILAELEEGEMRMMELGGADKVNS
jgi:hypothetical protein